MTAAEPSREQFLREASPRRGTANPERVRNATWEWLVRFGQNAYLAREHFAVAQRPANWPTWCFERFGRSWTRLPDGRLVCIGGEHEDHYDPDFFVYNDVAVLTPASDDAVLDFDRCGLELLAYAPDAFPPTDFHSATLVGDEIVVIGGLGYPDERREGHTPVRVLDTRTFAFRELATHGAMPGWIFKHAARYEPASHSILVAHGEVQTGGELAPNEKAFRLDLRSGQWERATSRALRRVCSPEHGHLRAGPDLPAALRTLGLPLVKTWRSVSGNERWLVFAGGGAVLEVDDGGFEIGVEPDEHEPAVAAAIAGLLRALAGQTGCEWSASWGDGGSRW